MTAPLPEEIATFLKQAFGEEAGEVPNHVFWRVDVSTMQGVSHEALSRFLSEYGLGTHTLHYKGSRPDTIDLPYAALTDFIAQQQSTGLTSLGQGVTPTLLAAGKNDRPCIYIPLGDVAESPASYHLIAEINDHFDFREPSINDTKSKYLIVTRAQMATLRNAWSQISKTDDHSLFTASLADALRKEAKDRPFGSAKTRDEPSAEDAANIAGSTTQALGLSSDEAAKLFSIVDGNSDRLGGVQNPNHPAMAPPSTEMDPKAAKDDKPSSLAAWREKAPKKPHRRPAPEERPNENKGTVIQLDAFRKGPPQDRTR